MYVVMEYPLLASFTFFEDEMPARTSRSLLIRNMMMMMAITGDRSRPRGLV